MKILKILGLAGLLLTAGSVLAEDGKAEKLKTDDAKAIVVKDKAPDFELVNQEGKTVKLSDYSGKNIVLVFSRAHW